MMYQATLWNKGSGEIIEFRPAPSFARAFRMAMGLVFWGAGVSQIDFPNNFSLFFHPDPNWQVKITEIKRRQNNETF